MGGRLPIDPKGTRTMAKFLFVYRGNNEVRQ